MSPWWPSVKVLMPNKISIYTVNRNLDRREVKTNKIQYLFTYMPLNSIQTNVW